MDRSQNRKYRFVTPRARKKRRPNPGWVKSNRNQRSDVTATRNQNDNTMRSLMPTEPSSNENFIEEGDDACFARDSDWLTCQVTLPGAVESASSLNGTWDCPLANVSGLQAILDAETTDCDMNWQHESLSWITSLEETAQESNCQEQSPNSKNRVSVPPSGTIFCTSSPSHGLVQPATSLAPASNPPDSGDRNREAQMSDETNFSLASPGYQSSNNAIDVSLISAEQFTSPVYDLLEAYNQNFCALPITSDFPSNPFRCHEMSSTASSALLHGFLAIAYYHRNREDPQDTFSCEMRFHQNAAETLSEMELKCNRRRHSSLPCSDLAQTLTLLFTFEAAQTAVGKWTNYLSRILGVLEEAGGPNALVRSIGLQTQFTICLWWDVTIALTCRENPVFPSSFFDTLLPLEKAGEWSFFDITGCPGDLFINMTQLAHMAAEKEIVARMRFTTFDTGAVDKIADGIARWNSHCTVRNENEATEEEVHHQEDRMHCFQAWKYALLLYIERVFRWNRVEAPSGKVKILARKVLDHVRVCRLSALVSKQVLMPVFFAGAELSDSAYRETALQYCDMWHRKSGYQPFADAGSLLRDLWKQQASSVHPHLIWWGSVIDQKHRAIGPEKRFKLG